MGGAQATYKKESNSFKHKAVGLLTTSILAYGASQALKNTNDIQLPQTPTAIHEQIKKEQPITHISDLNGLFVQYGTFSTAERAEALARQLGPDARINRTNNGLYRVLTTEKDMCDGIDTIITTEKRKSMLGITTPTLVKYDNNTIKDWNANDALSYDKEDAQRFSRMPYFPLVNTHAERNNVSVPFAYSVIRQESNFNPRAESRTGAKGLFQLIGATQKEHGVTQPFDLEQSIRGGTEHLREVANMFADDPELTAAAYNFGHNGVKRRTGCSFNDKKGQLSAEAQKYGTIVPRVFEAVQTGNFDEIRFNQVYAQVYNSLK